MTKKELLEKQKRFQENFNKSKIELDEINRRLEAWSEFDELTQKLIDMGDNNRDSSTTWEEVNKVIVDHIYQLKLNGELK